MVLNKLVAIFGHYLILFIFLSFTGVQLEFNSHLTGNPRSTEITDDNSTSGNTCVNTCSFMWGRAMALHISKVEPR